MNEIQIFKNAEFGEVRTLTGADGETWFVGKDVADILQYQNGSRDINRHVDEEDKATVAIHDGSQNRNVTVINESGLYSLVLSSKLPTAKKFRKWVTSEVLPTIRKHGAYMNESTLEKALTSPDFLIQLATQLKSEQERRKQLEEQAEQDRPKVLFANAVESSKTSILVGELAKILKQNGVDTGQKRLFAWLREHGFLIKREGTDYNMPTQRAMEQGLFEIKESTVIHADGHTSVTKTPKVTGKGQTFFISKFLSKNDFVEYVPF